MKRRTVLKVGMGGLVGVAAAGESGCATLPGRAGHVQEPLDPAVAEAALARIDARMASFGDLDLGIPEGLPHHQRETLRTRQELTRKTLRALYLAGAFHQVDEPLRYHPGMQERVRRMQGEMDETVQRVTDHLAALSPEERKRIQKELAAAPDLGTSVSQHLTEVASEDGFRFSQKAQLRYTLSDLERQMRKHNASAVIDRSVQRSRTMRARVDPMNERAHVAQMGEPAFRDLKQRAFDYSAGWEHIYAARPRIDRARLDELYPDEGGGAGADDPAGPKVLTVGGWMLGIGAVVEVTGLILFFGTGAVSTGGWTAVQTLGAVMCLYVGPALLALGLIVGIVGLVMTVATTSPSVAAPEAIPPAAAPAAPAM